MRSWRALSLFLLGLLVGLVAHQLAYPDEAHSDPRAQNVLLDYDQQKEIYGNAVGVAQATAISSRSVSPKRTRRMSSVFSPLAADLLESTAVILHSGTRDTIATIQLTGVGRAIDFHWTNIE